MPAASKLGPARGMSQTRLERARRAPLAAASLELERVRRHGVPGTAHCARARGGRAPPSGPYALQLNHWRCAQDLRGRRLGGEGVKFHPRAGGRSPPGHPEGVGVP
eukprot:SAG22_NODE_14876_length_362_cov_1.376426_1_plen_105_part_01